MQYMTTLTRIYPQGNHTLFVSQAISNSQSFLMNLVFKSNTLRSNIAFLFLITLIQNTVLEIGKMYFYYLRSNSSSPWPFTTYSFSLITNLIRIDTKINRHLSSARLRIGIASDIRQFRRTVTGGIHSVLFLYHWLLFISAVLDVYWLNACCQFWSCFFFALLLYQLTFSSHATVYTHQ